MIDAPEARQVPLAACSEHETEARKRARTRWQRAAALAAQIGKDTYNRAGMLRVRSKYFVEMSPEHPANGHDGAFAQARRTWLGQGGHESLLSYAARHDAGWVRVRYLDAAGRTACRVHFRDGRLFNAQGAALHGSYLYVLGVDRTLYAQPMPDASKESALVWRHSSFFAGGAVRCAGELVAEHGAITQLNARSGHYRPTEQHLDTLLRILRDNEVQPETCSLR